MFNTADVDRYERWFQTPQGRFAFVREKHLLERLTLGWPRRGQRLLEVGCGTGVFLQALWSTGFDVSGLDASPLMLAVARERLGDKADLHVGKAEHLPFDDNEYDFVALLTVLEFVDDPGQALREAARVARKGLLITFLNPASLYYLGNGLPLPFVRRSMLRQARWYTPLAMRVLIRESVGPRPVVARSVLPGPLCTWRNRPPWKWLNGFVLPGSLGAYCGMRVDLVCDKPLNPLLAFKARPKATPL
jgi:SAM-dependent methyltransferase